MGKIISHQYEELSQLGQGGQGMVYKVRHTERDTILALKALPFYLLDSEEAVARFEREVAVLQRLHHQNIVRVFDSGHDETLQLRYFVMEHIEGKSLKQYLKERGALPLPEMLEIGSQIARALVYAHRQSPPVIHRDIKPANIMVEEPSQRVVVLDFGIAKQLGGGDKFKTKTGAMLGTVKYCAPEQLTQKEITGSVDVYSLGLVMYEMVTGTQFFTGRDEYTVMAKVVDPAQENEPVFAAAVPSALADLIRKTIAKSPENRYLNMLEFLKDLEAYRRSVDESPTIVLPVAGSGKGLPKESGVDPVGLKDQYQSAMPQEERERQRDIITPKPQLAETGEPLRPRKVDSLPPPEQKSPLFTPEGKLNRIRFTPEAFRTLVTTTGDSHCVGDSRIAVFHLFISLTRGPFLGEFYQYVSRRTGKEMNAQLKVLRGLVRQSYRRPIVEERLIVRELHYADLESEMVTLLNAAALLVRPGTVAERHLLSALLGDVPRGLRAILLESGITLANLQRYAKEKGG